MWFLLGAAVACLAALLTQPTIAGSGYWTTGGPEGGLTRAIAVSPNVANDGVVFSAADKHGVFKSNDRGASWTWASTGMGNADVRSLAISPNFASDGTIFAGSLGAGLYRSMNGGQGWSQAPASLTSVWIWAVAVSPQYASDRLVFAASDEQGIFRSSDGGGSWTQVNTGLTLTSFLAIAVSPDFANDRTVFGGAQGGVFKSTDGGSSWSWAGTGIRVAEVRSLAISPNYAVDGTVFVGTERGGVFKTTNRGQLWVDPSGGRGPADISGLVVSPNYANDRTVYTSNDTLGYSKTTDGGATWAHHIPFAVWWPHTINGDGLSIAISPNYASDGSLWAGTIGTGMFRSQDFAQSWQLVRTGYHAARAHELFISPNYRNDRTVFALSLGGGLHSSNDAGQSWRQINSTLAQRYDFGPTTAVALSPDFAADQTIFAAGTGPIPLLRSRNGGAWWEPAYSGSPGDVNRLAISPAYTSDGTLFAASGSKGIYRSTNRGDQWAPVNSGLSSLSATDVVLSPDFASDRLAFAATDGGGVFRSLDGGSTWQAINTGFSSLRVRDLALSPSFSSDRIIFACTTSGLFRSSNGGASWSRILTDANLRAVAPSPRFSQDGVIYAGGQYGFWGTTNGGATWTNMTAGLGQMYVTDVTVGDDGEGHTVFAATLGASVWQHSAGGSAPPPTSTPSLTPIFGTPTRTATRTPTDTGTPTPTRTPVTATGPFRLNAGGPAYVDIYSRPWEADRAYTPGGYGYVDGKTYSTASSIEATLDDALYQTERWGLTGYRFDLANGAYRVELHIAEIYDFKPGARVFDVRIQGQTVLSEFCPYAAAGGRNIALRYIYQAVVSDGQLLIEFAARVGAPKVSAIGVELVGAAATATVQTTASPTATAPSAPSATATATATASVPAIATATATTGLPSPSRTSSPTPTRTATPSATATRASFSGAGLNSGGAGYTSLDGRLWQADRLYTPGGFGYLDGKTYSTAAAIANTEDDTLYQNERWGMTAYRFDLPNGLYRVELLFAEIYDFKPNARVFDVILQGQTVLSGFSPFSAAGGRNIALRYVYEATVSDGRLLIEFVARVSAPKINAIWVEPLSGAATATATATTAAPGQTATPTRTSTSTSTPTNATVATPTPTSTTVVTLTPTPTHAGGAAIDTAVNAGAAAWRGGDGVLWQADQAYTPGSWGYLGGRTFSAAVPIAGTDDDPLYHSERWGMSGYRFDVPPGTYTVLLRFAEVYGWKVGQRIFDVQIEEQTALANLDIFAAAGRYTAHDRQFTVIVSDGVLDIAFIPRLDAPKINAIRVTNAGP